MDVSTITTPPKERLSFISLHAMSTYIAEKMECRRMDIT